MPTISIPPSVEKYAKNLAPYPAALIGCRAQGVSHECCEYDIAVFANDIHENKVVKLDGHVAELLYLAGPAKNYILDVRWMVTLADSNKFVLASAAKDVTDEKYRRALESAGKKSLVSSLLCQRKMNEKGDGSTVVAMWAKLASYQFIAGAIALSGARPMPLHELEQLRQTDVQSSTADGIQAALECIGMERATRPTLSRSIEAIRELKSKDYDRDLVMSKIDYLLQKQMLADCYFYAGKMAADNLAKERSPFYSRYAKLIQISMDLTSDVQHLARLQQTLFRSANTLLKG